MKVSDKTNKILGVIKYPVTILILFFVFTRIDLSKIAGIIKELQPGFLIVLVSISIIKIFLQFSNWSLFLKLNPESRLTLSQKITSFFVGITFKMIIPGGVGVYGRMLYLPIRKKDSFLSITYEKLIQAWCVLFLGSIASALFFQDLSLALKIILPLVTLSLPFILLVISPLKKRYYSYFQQYKLTLLPALMIQILTNLLTIYQYKIFLSYYNDFGFYDSLRSVPLVQAGNLIPITISGLGIREYLAVQVYPALGVSAELAVSCSLIVFSFSNLFPALVGVIFLLSRPNIQVKK